MKIIIPLLLQLAVAGMPEAGPHRTCVYETHHRADSAVNRIYLAVKNRLHFDSTGIKILAILPTTDVQVSIKPGYLELLPFKTGTYSIRVRTNQGIKIIDCSAQPIPDNKSEANRIIGEKRSLIIR